MGRVPRLDPDAVAAYVRRDWAAVEAASARSWADRPVSERLATSEALYEEARRFHPEWPSPEDREGDLRDLLALKARLGRAPGVRAR